MRTKLEPGLSQGSRRLSLWEPLLFTAALAIILAARVHNLHYNTLFLDEAINAVIGEDLWQGIFVRGGVRFLFGSYLYPALSGLLSALGGVSALRIGSAVTTTAAAVFVYMATRILFQGRAALLAMLLFGLTGASISVGQLAVYDTLALPFLALALALMVRACTTPKRGNALLLAGSFAMVGAVLAKYIGVLYLPVLMAAGLCLFLSQGQSFRHALRRLLIYWLLPVIILLSCYALYYYDDLLEVVAQQGFAPGARGAVVELIGREIGPAIVLALLGYLLLARCLWRNDDCAPAVLSRFRQWEAGAGSVRMQAVILPACAALLLLSLAGPLYHIWGANIRSLWKNVIYSLIFLAPVAGYFLGRLLALSTGQKAPLTRAALLSLFLVFSAFFLHTSWQRNVAHQHSWPSVTGVIAFLRDAGLDEHSRVVAEAMDIYEYYFDFGVDDRLIWSSIWYAYYEPPAVSGEAATTIKGPEVVELGIRSRYFDFVIIDDYYAPGTRQALAPLLEEAGYRVTYSDVQIFPGDYRLLLEVYEPP